MNIEEIRSLSLGGWVSWGNHSIRITELMYGGVKGEFNHQELSNWLTIDDVKPIPLTPEILEASGFEHSADDEDRYSFEDTTIIFKHDTEYLFSASVNGSKGMLYLCANYVHELNLALRLCGLNDLADNLKVEE